MGRNGPSVSTVSTGQRTALYRHFDANGELLYVGISLNAVSRLAQHRQTSPWFDEIARIEIEWHPTREDACDAEITAIHTEHPRYNVIHSGMPVALRDMLKAIGGLHMVDANGILLPEHASLTVEEADELADRL